MDNQRFFYDTIADRFDELHNTYDLSRRLSIVFEELLPFDIRGLKGLDLGCGSGWFSKKALERGIQLTSLDISQNLARITQKRTSSNAVVADAVSLPFSENSFDIIISSEMIEHLGDVEHGIREISRVLSPGGILVLTTPNRHWLWLVNFATRLKLRPYEGFENFLRFDELSQLIEKYSLEIKFHIGFHPWPFQIKPLQKLSLRVDKRFGNSSWAKWMINQAIYAIKKR
jgi:2-polyprenyl-3-methyl-5-hydroxy-6-metoxy-1,4-benzoquinol methylase